jgi:hypothetical protein
MTTMNFHTRALMPALRAVAILGIGSLIPLSASAEMGAPGPSGADFGWVLAGGGEFGGDDVATVSFENGDKQDIKAGQGLWVGVGGYYKPEYLSPYSVRATVGFKYTTTKASNADIDLSRVPLELIGSYQFPNGTRLGAGLVHHTNVKLDGDGYFEDVDFDDATGFKLEAGWKWIVVSYTNLDYKASDFDDKVDASSFGVSFIGEF